MIKEPCGRIIAVARSNQHGFSKKPVNCINLIQGHGVEDDAHFGTLVQHRSRVTADPSQPNLRQVHLLHNELFTELDELGFSIKPGEMGENITTQNIDLLGLPRGTKLHLGDDAILEVTGLRNPCRQLNNFMPGLMQAVLDIGPDQQLIRKAGIMAIVTKGGIVQTNDLIRITPPEGVHFPLKPV